MIALLFLAALVFLLFVLDSNRRAAVLIREIEALRRRLDQLERRSRTAEAEVVEAEARAIPPPAEPSPATAPAAGAERAAAAPPERAPSAVQSPPPPGTGTMEPALASAPPAGSAPPPAAPQAPPADAPSAAAPRPARDVEQLVGAVWLQNAGAVLLLVGFFFMIVWGYASGRLGPGVLVAAGVLAGLGLVWRGIRMRRSVRGVGHALIGVGAGVVWLSIWLGHFRLGVLPAPAAFALVVAASLLTAALGLRYRAQDIAALGVIGAHLPNVLGLPERFHLPDGALLGYLAALNALVFALAARVGWSALALGSLLLTAWAWIAGVPAVRWSWPVEIGLAALFAGLGLAPVPRLARAAGPVRAVDIAVIAAAPLALLAASTPMFLLANPRFVAILLLVLAAAYMGAALWVDGRRPERDLWRPLTAAAILFLTAALERAVGPERTALAWMLEGAALVLLGLAPRGGWLRACGHVVVYLGALRLLADVLVRDAGHPLPLANAPAVTAGLAIAALLFAAHRIRRHRRSFGLLERIAADVWFLGAHALLMVWLTREAHHLAWALERDGGAWRAMRDVRAPAGDTRYWSLLARATALAWLVQAAWLARSGLTGRGLLTRLAAALVAVAAAVAFLGGLLFADGWGRDLAPLIHRDALIALAAAAVAAWTAARLARSRGALERFERVTPEFWASAAALMLLVWIAREAEHLARAMLGLPGAALPGEPGRAARAGLRALAGTLTSAGWLIEAVGAFALGWFRRSAFLRWTGLTLIGVTVMKFLLVDLAGADPFWRFLTALGAGAAMLVLSYVYQRAGAARRQPDGPRDG